MNQHTFAPVRTLQIMLRSISNEDPRILPVIPDGFYGGITAASVRSFQETRGLPVTGLTDFETWTHIVQSFSNPFRLPTAVLPTISSYNVFQRGDSNLHLFLAKAMFAALSHHFPALPQVTLNAELDQHTETGIRWLQRAGNQLETGWLDPTAWQLLTAIYRVIIADGTLPI